MRKKPSLIAKGLAALALALAACAPARAADYDVLIRGGDVIDGTGSARHKADVAIKGDRIVAIGAIPANDHAARVIDASGKVVSPGFIDPHSHSGPSLMESALAPALPMLYQGITTLMVNPDGGGPADLTEEVAAIRRNVPGVNVIPLIGHNAVREAVMGLADRKATPDDVAKMQELVRKGMQAGAFGLSSGPFYIPGKYSDTAEIAALARTAAQFPGAFHTSHIRDESDYDIGVVKAVGELIEVSRETGIRGIVTHVKVLGPSVWGQSAQIIDMVNKARAEGLSIWTDQYPYTASSSTLQAALVPGWAQEGGAKAVTERLQDPQQLPRIREEMLHNLERRAGAHAIQIRNYGGDPLARGKRLDEIAAARGEVPIDTAIDMLKHGGADIISYNMSDDDVDAFMQQPWNMTCTDGPLLAFGTSGGHPSGYGTFARKIRLYVMERKVITLEQAIHSSTGLTAEVYGIEDRGLLRAGAYADVLVFDPAKVRDVATYEEPHAYSEGMDYILVNGAVAVADGKALAERSGRVLLKQR